VINFSGISNSSLLGRALRLPLRFVPDGAVLRVIQGPLRGKRWIAGSSNHGCWLGSYELRKQRKVIELVRPGMVCWDVGANVGFYTLLFAELVGPSGKVLAFEPLPRNVDLLRRHVEMNGYRNVRIFPRALADFDGEASFDPGPNPSMGRIAPSGPLRVPCARADTLLATGEVEPPDVIKIDVEGAEAAVLRGARQMMERHPVMLLATHGVQAHRECLGLLAAAGYKIRALDGGPGELTNEIVAATVVPAPGCPGCALRA
jgi:FkbM family methyltransferase